MTVTITVSNQVAKAIGDEMRASRNKGDLDDVFRSITTDEQALIAHAEVLCLFWSLGRIEIKPAKPD